MKLAGAVIFYAALPGRVQPPLTAVVADPPFTDGAAKYLPFHVPSGSPLRYVLLRRRKAHAASLFSPADAKPY